MHANTLAAGAATPHLHDVVAGVCVGSKVEVHGQLLVAEPQALQVVCCLAHWLHKVTGLVTEGHPASKLQVGSVHRREVVHSSSSV
jgi:hypothetical protein